MSTPVLIVVFVVALVFSLGFLLLVLTLVPAIQQFKSLLLDMEKTSLEVRDLARELKRVSAAHQARAGSAAGTVSLIVRISVPGGTRISRSSEPNSRAKTGQPVVSTLRTALSIPGFIGGNHRRSRNGLSNEPGGDQRAKAYAASLS